MVRVTNYLTTTSSTIYNLHHNESLSQISHLLQSTIPPHTPISNPLDKRKEGRISLTLTTYLFTFVELLGVLQTDLSIPIYLSDRVGDLEYVCYLYRYQFNSTSYLSYLSVRR